MDADSIGPGPIKKIRVDTPKPVRLWHKTGKKHFQYMIHQVTKQPRFTQRNKYQQLLIQAVILTAALGMYASFGKCNPNQHWDYYKYPDPVCPEPPPIPPKKCPRPVKEPPPCPCEETDLEKACKQLAKEKEADKLKAKKK